jgi:predicted transcriptional regulator
MVLEIRSRYAAGGISQAALAREYGVSQPKINYVVNRKTWRHV